jgi:hypothetical protein
VDWSGVHQVDSGPLQLGVVANPLFIALQQFTVAININRQIPIGRPKNSQNSLEI